MAFKLENFGSEVANIKNIFGGVCYYTYKLEGADNPTTAGFFPSNLGIKQDDRIDIIPSTPGAIIRYVANVVDGVITCVAEGDI